MGGSDPIWKIPKLKLHFLFKGVPKCDMFLESPGADQKGNTVKIGNLEKVGKVEKVGNIDKQEK